MADGRLRVAALIEEAGRLLVALQRARDGSGLHFGELYMTPPGGGVEPGEALVDAVEREVREETGLVVTSTEYVSQIAHTGGSTTVFRVTVQPGQPEVGVDPELNCECPRLVGLRWIDAPALEVWTGPDAKLQLKIVVADAL